VSAADPMRPPTARRRLRRAFRIPAPPGPSNARFLTVDSVRWVIRNRAVTPWYLARYWRFLRFKLANPHIITTGIVFLDRGTDVSARRGYGRLILGRWVHVGAGTAIRCHEGTLRIGDRCVFGRHVAVNSYLDVDIGSATMFADYVYVSDFDHRTDVRNRHIKDQGIVKARVRIGRDVWLGTKATVARGVAIGDGVVVGANAVVTRDLPPYTLAVGAPARVVRDRGSARN
jgi:acetyltransferase-like isoleucine patch superfamily enzyme